MKRRRTFLLLVLIILGLSAQVLGQQQGIVVGDVNVDDEQKMGNEEAPVIIVEYVDFQCPFCKRFAEETLRNIKEQYIDTGVASLSVKHFPLDFHPLAFDAALAAECAGEQGKFFEMHDLLFKTQELWNAANNKGYLKSLASQLGLNKQSFDKCFDSEKYKKKIRQDIAEGTAQGVQGTPTFFINGKPLVGAQPFDNFVKAIERARGKPSVIQPPVVQPKPLEPKSPPVTVPLQVVCGSGCSVDGKCYSFGARLIFKEVPSYCGFEGKLLPQKEAGEPAQENFECGSNRQSDGACVDDVSILQKIARFFSRFF